MYRKLALAILFHLALYDAVISQPAGTQYQFRRLDISKGLSHNQVTCFLKDSKGFMWIGTMSGLNRYDGYTFRIFKHNPKDSTSVNDDYISRLTEMPDGKLLVETRGWLDVYDPTTEKFIHQPVTYLASLSLPAATIIRNARMANGDYYFLLSQLGLFKYSAATRQAARLPLTYGNKGDIITGFTRDTTGSLWLVHNNGLIEQLDTRTDRIVYSSKTLSNYMPGEVFNYAIYADAQNELWLYVASEPHGLFRFDPATGELGHITRENGSSRLNTNLVMGVLQDNQSRIWAFTDHGGINVIDKKDGSIRYLVNNTDDNNSLSQNSIIASYKDNSGIIWVGTYKKGVSYYHENSIKFPLYRHQPSNSHSLPYDDVNRFVEDAKGNLWIGTNGGGLIYYDRANNTYRQYLHQADNINSPGNDVIVSLYIDKKQRLWIGSFYGGLDCYEGGKFTHYQHNPADKNSLADNRVWEIYEDSNNDLWVGTLGKGLDKLDRERNIFEHYTAVDKKSIHSNFISEIKEDADRNLWIGTADGVDVKQAGTQRFVHYGMSSGLSNNNVLSIFMDSRQRVWVGTRDGLNLFNKKAGSFQHFTTEDGLPDNTVLTILEDDKKNLWLGTPNGISDLTISPDTGERVKIGCKNYDESDGLQGTEFNENAALKTSRGELIFGGANGFNIFQSQDIAAGKQAPGLAFTDLQVFNKSVAVGEKLGNEVLLPQSITQTTSITLNYNQNVLAIEFAALSFSNTDKIRYAYILEGFNKDWLMTDGKARKAVYTNLDPGDYTFRVKADNSDGSRNDNGIELHIKILPPFWKSPLAYVVYALVIVLALYIGRRRIIKRARAKFAIEQERQEAQRMHELDLMKIKFFTNVSHEFRTPLSLILAPLDKIFRQGSEWVKRDQLQLVHRNARRLLNLVNQLLDFRKMEERELKLHLKQGDIVEYISDVSHFFSDVADKKNISFSFHSDKDSLLTSFDHDKIERILFNLLSNAFKFTPENGHVGVTLAVRQTVPSTGACDLIIAIQDTGIGIEAGKQEKIFERFFQDNLPGSMVNQGSGIGLAITKEFVKLHGGTISVESEPDKGSCFLVTLPVVALAAPALLENIAVPAETVEIADELPAGNGVEREQTVEEDGSKQKNKRPVVLLIEDNDDFLFYLKDNLKEYFTIVEATNGKLGWQKTLAAHPDLVVSDISMPEMNGIDLCKKIKNDKRTNHIPVILLTALSGEEQELRGLETGASDYMTKPFNFEILLSKIKNQLRQQAQLKKTYQKQLEVKPADVELASPNEKFMHELLALVEKNIGEYNFSVEDMSREMLVSRVALYKRVLSLTGKTPIEFIRQVRLKRAAQLLEKSNMTVAEVAYKAGFKNPKYFSKYFRTEYDKLPSVYAEEMRRSNIPDSNGD